MGKVRLFGSLFLVLDNFRAFFFNRKKIAELKAYEMKLIEELKNIKAELGEE
jgi:hypothetical protein